MKNLLVLFNLILLPLFGYGQNKYYGTFTGDLSGGTNLQATNVVNLKNNSAAVSMVGEDSTGHLTTNAVPSGGGTVYATNIVGVIPQPPTVTIANNAPSTNLVMVTDASGNRWWSNAIPGGVSVPATNLTGIVPSANLPPLNYVANTNGTAYNPTIYNPATNIWTVLTVVTNYVVSDGTNLYYVNASTNGVQTNEIETISSGNLTQTLTTTNKGLAYFNGTIFFLNGNQQLNQVSSTALMISGSSSSGIEELNFESFGGRASLWGLTSLNATSSWLCTTNGGQTNWVTPTAVVATNGFASYATHIPNAVSVGASPYSFTNTISVALECYFSDAAAYTLAKNGTTVSSGLTGDDYFVMQPGSYFTLTYSSTTPTVNTNAW